MIYGQPDRVGVRLPGQHDFQRQRKAAMNFAQEFMPFHARHDLICDNDRKIHRPAIQFFEKFQRLFAALDRFNPVISAEPPLQMLF